MACSNNITVSPHDEKFASVFEAENKSLSRFFDALFSYFSRSSPEILFDCNKHYGRQILISEYDKWQARYKKNILAPSKSGSSSSVRESFNNGSSSKRMNWESTLEPGGGPTNTTNTSTVSKRTNEGDVTSITESKKEKKYNSSNESFFDVTNGAHLEGYSWTQSIEDLEVRIPVEDFVKKGSQVKIDVGKKSLKVLSEKSSEFAHLESIIDGELCDSVKSDESIWFLSPAQHISILLEKKETRWWDRLLTHETPIDLSKIYAERQFSSLPEEDRTKIEKIISDRRKQERGEPTSEQDKMTSVLRKAWDMEGSPFRGQPFDPSLVQMVNNTTSESGSLITFSK